MVVRGMCRGKTAETRKFMIKTSHGAKKQPRPPEQIWIYRREMTIADRTFCILFIAFAASTLRGYATLFNGYQIEKIDRYGARQQLLPLEIG